MGLVLWSEDEGWLKGWEQPGRGNSGPREKAGKKAAEETPDDTCEEVEGIVKAKQGGALVRGAVGGKQRGVDDEDDSDGGADGERGEQDNWRCGQDDLGGNSHSADDIGPDEHGAVTQPVDEEVCRDDAQTAADRADHQHQADELGAIAELG